MIWLNFLHFYQPANVEQYNIKKALDKSYWRLIRLSEEHPDYRLTANISGCLLERLEDGGEKDFIERLKFLVKKGRIELTGSAYYHGFLPLLPEKEVVRQIKENEKCLRRHFGKNFKPSGFFLPELAYSPSVAKLIKKLGYKWLLVDEIAFPEGPVKIEHEHPYVDVASGLLVIFRDRSYSSTYPPDKLLSLPKEELESDKVILTATDAELYGLRHEDPTGEMEKVVKRLELKTVTFSKWLRQVHRKKARKLALRPSTWETTEKEMKEGKPYQLWRDKNNKIQTNLWKLAALAMSLEEKYKKDKNYHWYRWHLARGLASCTFWWASARDFSKVFGPYAWSPDDIERGLEDLVRSIRSLNDPKTKKKKMEAEKIYLKIKRAIWEDHWRKHWRKVI